MKKLFATLISILLLFSISTQAYVLVDLEKANGSGYVTYRGTSIRVQIPDVYEEQETDFRGVWISTMTGDIAKYQSISQYQAEINSVFNIMEHYNLNAMVFHIRIYNDALYDSQLNKRSSYYSTVNFASWDPLAWIIEECHKRGIEFHAWMNPYRVKASGAPDDLADYAATEPSYNIASNPEYLLRTGANGIILNPGEPAVREFLVNTCLEVVEKYDVDAIHFDDYFYANGVDDAATRAKYNTTGLSIADFRRLQVDLFIEQLSNELRAFNERTGRVVQLGIAPTGIYRNGSYTSTYTYDENGNLTSPVGSNTGGFAHYGDYLYCDTKKWIDNEWIDYILPQSYWGFEHSTAGYADVMDWWDKVVEHKDVNLYSGMGVYMIDGGTWSGRLREALNQIKYGAKLKNVQGHCIYSYKHLKYAYQGSGEYAQNFQAVKNEAWKRKAIMSEIRNYDPVVLPAVENLTIAEIGAHNVLSFTNNPQAKFYVIYRSLQPITYAPEEVYDIIGGLNDAETVTYTDSDAGEYFYAVRPLSRTNTLGAGATVKKANLSISYLYDDENEIMVTDITTYGSAYVHDFTVREGYDFVYWVVNGVVRDDLPADCEFTVTANMNLQAVFRPANKHIVLFIDSNGALIATRYVDPGASATPPTDLPDKPGLRIADVPWKTRDNITDLTNITSDRVYVLQYELDNDAVYTLTLDGEISGTYHYNQIATVTTPVEKDGLPFSHWEEAGRIVSYRTSFSFTMLSDRSLTAVYGTADEKSLITMGGMMRLRAAYYSFLGRIELLDGYELIEAGYLIASGNGVPVMGDATVEAVPVPKFNAVTGEFLMSFPESLFARINAIRAYLVVRSDDGDIEVHYSDYCHFEDQEERDAERERLTAYLAGIPEQILVNYDLNNDDFCWEYKEGEDQSIFDLETGVLLKRPMTQAVRTFVVSSRRYPGVQAEHRINFGMTPEGVVASINGNETTPADPEVYNVSTYYQKPFTGYTLSFTRSGVEYRHYAVYHLEITDQAANLKPSKSAGSIGILYVNKTGADLTVTVTQTHVTNSSAYTSPVINADGVVIAIIGAYNDATTVTIPKDGTLWAPAYLDGPVAGNANSANINVKTIWQVGDVITIEKGILTRMYPDLDGAELSGSDKLPPLHWNSSNPAVIASDGTITPDPLADTEVTLTAVIGANGESEAITVIVKKQD